MWLNFLAIAISLSGLRRYLDPASPAALPALGFIDGLLNWFSSACIPVLLFANGVWMSDKQVFSKQGQLQVRGDTWQCCRSARVLCCAAAWVEVGQAGLQQRKGNCRCGQGVLALCCAGSARADLPVLALCCCMT